MFSDNQIRVLRMNTEKVKRMLRHQLEIGQVDESEFFSQMQTIELIEMLDIDASIQVGDMVFKDKYLKESIYISNIGKGIRFGDITD